MQIKVLYSNEPYNKTYNFIYGIPSLRIPYKFFYADGVGAGKYKFIYDSRDEIYNQELKQQFVFWGREIDRAKLFQKFSFIERQVFSMGNKFFSKIATSEVEKTNLNHLEPKQKLILKNSYMTLNKIIEELKIMNIKLLGREVKKNFFLKNKNRLSKKEKNINLQDLIVKIRKVKKELDLIEKIFFDKSFKNIKIYRNILLELDRRIIFKKNSKMLDLKFKNLKINKKSLLEVKKRKIAKVNIKYLDRITKDINPYKNNKLARSTQRDFNCISHIKCLSRLIESELDSLEGLFLLTRGNENEQGISINFLKLLFNDLSSRDHELSILKKEIYLIQNKIRRIEFKKLFNFFLRENSKEIFKNKLSKMAIRKMYHAKTIPFEKQLERFNIKPSVRIKLKNNISRTKQKDSFIYKLTKFLERTTVKEILLELLEFELTRRIMKNISNELYSQQIERDIVLKIKTVDLKHFAQSSTILELFKDTFIKFLVFELIKPLNNINTHKLGDKIPKEKFIKNTRLGTVIEKNVYKNLFSYEDIKKVEKNVIFALQELIDTQDLERIPSKKDLFENFPLMLESEKLRESTKSLAESKKLLIEERALDKVSLDRKLKLYKRLWFINEIEPYDLLILPSDYPYDSEPIYFDEGSTQNYPGVVYPHNLYKEIISHPIPWGSEFENEEIPVAINIMIEIINIFILLWSKFYKPFWGWTGTQAVLGITNSLYEWITLETSTEEMNQKGVKRHYERVFKWVRWEAEKMALLGRNDTDLNGNYYIELFLEELIYYLIDHHVDVVPIFESVEKMDEWRHIFKNRSTDNDLKFVLKKVKGLRHKLIIGKEQKENA